MPDLSLAIIGRRGRNRRTPALQIALATRIMDQEHEQDVIDRAKATHGSRTSLLQPVDLSRNALVSYAERVGRAYFVPPMVSGLTADLAAVLGDYSASTTIADYAEADGRPLPTTTAAIGTECLRYRLGVGFAGSLIDYDERSRRLVEEVIAPDDLELEYGGVSQTEPTIIRHRGERTLDGERRAVVEVYDLTDLSRPYYRVLYEDRDVTERVHGQTFEADSYPWRDENGPFHRVVMTGHNRTPYRTNPLVEATLLVCVRWSVWGLGTDHASHAQRHVRGMVVLGSDSDEAEEQVGVPTGAESVVVWADTDPERPGSHWQDAPPFDPKTNAQAIRTYETSAMNALGLPLDYEATGGEPTARELEALQELQRGTYAECRRFDGERLRRASAMARMLADQGLLPEGDYPIGPFGVLYRDEVTAALAPDEEDSDNGGRNGGRGEPGDEDPGRDQEDGQGNGGG